MKRTARRRMKKRHWLLLALLALAIASLCVRELVPGRGAPKGPTIRFIGAAQRVGGSCLLVENRGARFIVDCGALGEVGSGALPPHPDSLSFVILTHAHVDHCGLLPELFNAGFRGKVYCTRGTAELVPIMLDMMRGISKDKLASEAFDKAVASLTPVPFGQAVAERGVLFTFRRAEHLLGAASVEMRLPWKGDTVGLVVSGDLGSGNSFLLEPLEEPGRADYVVMESTYGASVRDTAAAGARRDREAFARAIGAALSRGGDVLIPAFTLGRTQEAMAAIDGLIRAGAIPPETEVYVDSPTARRITDAYRRMRDELSTGAREFYPVDMLRFPTLREVRSRTSLKVHARRHRPTVFVSSSGDLDYANSPRHLMRMFADRRNLVCIIGWQPPGSLGARLLAGETPVLVKHREGKLLSEDWISPALAVKGFHSFSAHADGAGLLAWLGGIRGVHQVFLVHGEKESAQALARSIRKNLAMAVEIPERGDSFVLRTGGRAAPRMTSDSTAAALDMRRRSWIPIADSLGLEGGED